MNLADIRKHLPPGDLESFDAGLVEDGVIRNAETTWRLLDSGLVLRLKERGSHLQASFFRVGEDVGGGDRPRSR